MGLHDISSDSTISWHCHGKDCDHHNCADPLDSHGTPKGCEHHKHLDADQRPAGTPLTAHIAHEDVQWTRCGTMISLPQCGCGTQLFVKAVFTDSELAAPNLTIQEYEEYQDQVLDKDEERLRLALAKHGIEIDQVVHIVKQHRVVGSHPHPMVARHQELARQLIEAGKTVPEALPSEESQGWLKLTIPSLGLHEIEEEAEETKQTKRHKRAPRSL